MYLNGGILNEHNDQDIFDGVPGHCCVDDGIRCFMGHVADTCSRLVEKKFADKALIEKCTALFTESHDVPGNITAVHSGCRIFFNALLVCAFPSLSARNGDHALK
jgi:hypothetical protein